MAQFRASGAYIFRPNGSEPKTFGAPSNVVYEGMYTLIRIPFLRMQWIIIMERAEKTTMRINDIWKLNIYVCVNLSSGSI